MSILALFAKIHRPKRMTRVSSFRFIVSDSGFEGADRRYEPAG